MSEDAPSVEQLAPERLAIVVDVWKRTVDVQMHFNDIEMKVRSLYFTILAASFALIGVVQGKWIEVPDVNASISVTLLVVFALIPVSALFYFMDRHWYHRLLQGAVAQSACIESQYSAVLPEIQLGAKISEASPVKLGRLWPLLFFFIRDKRFRNGRMLHSDQKIEVMYKSVMVFALLVFFGYALFNGVKIGDQALFWHWRG